MSTDSLRDLLAHVRSGRVSKQEALSLLRRQPRGEAAPLAAADAGSFDLPERALDFLLRLFAASLKLTREQIDADTPLERYGVHSVQVLRLNAQLERHFGALSKTMLFEFRTVRAVAKHLVESRRESWVKMFGAASLQPTAAPSAASTPTASPRPLSPTLRPHDIAIVGIAGRYPKARTLDDLWENLRSGRDCIGEVPAERWNAQTLRGEDGGSVGRWGGFVDGVAEFDPLFFHISPAQAERMEPESRLFLQAAHEALEDAGYTSESLSRPAGRARRKVGVFVGSTYHEYQLYGAQSQQADDRLFAVSGSAASIANRVSYHFDFNGPSLALDTMCSSSLTALHLACESLRRGECDAAIAGGVSLSLHPNKYIYLSHGKFLSPNGRCEAFGQGDGYVPAEGVGAVLLRPLADALADGDTVLGVILATAVNHGGHTNGYTVPDPAAQAAVIRDALRTAGVSADHVSYVEAHGTGTSLGDPIEIEGLARAYGEHTASLRFCAIGSIKSNIGHAEAAAGIAGLTKVLLQMKHGMLVPSLHSERANPHIDFDATPFVVQQELAEWPLPASGGPRIAGISSFGAGGANAHLIVREHVPPQASSTTSGTPQLLVLSARDEDRLRAMAERLLAAIEGRPLRDQELPNMAWTLQVGRDAMEERLAWIASSMVDAATALRAFLGQRDAKLDEVDEANVIPWFRGRVGRAAVTEAADDDLAAAMSLALDAWIAKGKLHRIAQCWVRGTSVDWVNLHSGAPVHRMQLPTYPFAAEVCWLPQPRKSISTMPLDAVARPRETLPPREAIGLLLRQLLSRQLKLAVHRIDVNASMDEYGLDSVMALALTRELEQTFGPLSKTLFFEYQSLAELTDYFADQHAGQARELSAAASTDGAQPSVRPRAATTTASAPRAVPAERHKEGRHEEGIAIVGLAGSYPNAVDLDAFWTNLVEGVNCIAPAPCDRWPCGSDPARQPRGGFISEADRFDARFFNISPRDALAMNPQTRVALQCAYATLEDAGYTRDELLRRSGDDVGVFMGCSSTDYQLHTAHAAPDGPVLHGTIATLANRLSYYFNLSGPSMTIDTMCSSSLVALHLACESLHRGECRAALAGGVNLLVHPYKFTVLAHGQFLSSEGLCRSFGNGGDGYVPAEGVGMVLLKPLADAQSDGDHVYAVIKGTAINHGGKTHGFTVPNPKAQRRVIRRALERAGVDARSISYVEAQATGTALGDPIEITGLTEAYREDTRDIGYCAIGSVKTNIGHAEAAAGMAGLTKVLLQMKHGTLVKSLHSDVLNPNIDFANTPFVVQRETQPWRTPSRDVDGLMRSAPRIAAVSAFGAGGSNAHVIVEEPQPPPAREQLPGPVLVVMSARSVDRLHALGRALLATLTAGPAPDLRNLAYTLQVGREAMDERFAVVVETLAELIERLRTWLDATRDMQTWVIGRADRATALDVEALRPSLEDQRDRDALIDIAQAWARGVKVVWESFYQDQDELPLRVSLPTYPFAGERYWPELGASIAPSSPSPEIAAAASSAPWQGDAELQLTHDPDSLRSQMRLPASDFFLTDHRVAGRPVLPGVVHLEIALRALQYRAGQPVILERVVFLSPLAVEEEHRDVALLAQREGEGFAWRVETEDEAGKPVVHSQGYARLATLPVIEPLDVIALRRGATRALSINAVYERYRGAGLDHGPSMRALRAMHAGTDAQGDYLLASLEAGVGGIDAGWLLPPALMDSALQACSGFTAQASPSNGETPAAMLPFVMERVQRLEPIPASCQVVIRQRSEPQAAVRQLDLQIIDDAGRLCVEIHAFSSRAMAAHPQAQATSIDTLSFSIDWAAQALEPALPEPAAHLVFLCESSQDGPEAIERHLRSLLPQTQVLHANFSHQGLARRYTDCALQLLAQLQALQKARPASVLVQLVVALSGEGAVFEGLAGMLKSAARENPRIRWQALAVEPDLDAESLAHVIKQEMDQPSNEIRHRYGRGREIKRFRSMPEVAPAATHWRSAGTYLVTGGAGGLGLLVADHIAQQAQPVTLVLTGRSAPTAQLQAKLDRLRARGAQVDYVIANVSEPCDVARLIDHIQHHHGGLTGIVHAAGVLRDSFVLRKSEQQLREVFAPKVQALALLDHATSQMPLEFFCAFASVSGIFGNLGQVDYSAANAFMDAYLRQRQERVEAGERSGQSLSIDWPLWESGGMQVDDDVRRQLWTERAAAPMPTAAGLSALDRLIPSGQVQAVVYAGDAKRLLARLKPLPADEPPATGPSPSNLETTTAPLLGVLTELAAHELGMAARHVEIDVPLAELGFDSVSYTRLATALSRAYGIGLMPTVFFEHPSLEQLASHLCERHADAVERVHSVAEAFAKRPTEPPASAATHAPSALEQKESDAVAIVGMSGVFPQAPDIDTLWQNLLAARDCVTELPADRWPGSDAAWPRSAGVIDGIDRFDPLFFGISPREAQGLDPQHRLLMTHVWKALEEAGHAPSSLSGKRVAIFIGTTSTGYDRLLLRANAPVDGMTAAGTATSMGPARMSYWLDVSGPSEPVNTACSSGLVAVHRGLMAIEADECDLAIVGAVNTLLSPEAHRSYNEAGMLSQTGRCQTFSADADGYVRGEGAAVFVLRRLSDAERDGDHVHALVLGSAVNHGGRATSLTAPNPHAQTDLIVRALRKAGVSPSQIGYVETHGTGTPLGDPIEVNALKAAFTDAAAPHARCGLGSIKTNIGHLEIAAGAAGLVKTILQLQHRRWVPSLHAQRLNPYLALDDSPFFVVRENAEWPATRDAQGRLLPRCAGVSSFGFGGVNAHVVLQEYVPRGRAMTPVARVLIVLSARDHERLIEQARRLNERLPHLADTDLIDIAYTLQFGRDALEWRLALAVGSIAELRTALCRFIEEPVVGSEAPYHVGECRRDGRPRYAARQAAASQDLLSRWGSEWVLGMASLPDRESWAALYPGVEPRRLSLPTYAFAEMRCWVPTADVVVPAADAVEPMAPAASAALDRNDAQRAIAAMIARHLGVEPNRLDPRQPLERYGLDSVQALGVTQVLEPLFGPLPRTLMFEYPTVEALTAHLLSAFPSQMASIMPATMARPGAAAVPAVVSVPPRAQSVARHHPMPAVNEDIAIVGVAGRYPRAHDLQAYWLNLLHGVNCISEVPAERWDHASFFDPRKHQPGKTYANWGGFLDGVDRFDASFFSIPPVEAARMDPQERLFLQCVYATIEDAGYTRHTVADEGRAGVFVGVMYEEYQLYAAQSQLREDGGFALSGSAASIANRVSYWCDFHGPSLVVDTMCSSSLTAIHLACESLKRGQCDVAIAGGVNVSVHPNKFLHLAHRQFAASDGLCKSFGEGGDGYVPAEGVGAVLLKPLARAIEDGDRIHGVIKGTALNHGGKTNGYTVPNPAAQSQVIREALKQAGVAAREVSYVEAHGTGTSLGDPIEIAGLAKAYGESTEDLQYCAIGSAKSNIGHAESAAGIAGLTKVLLQMKHRTLVKSLHSQTLNPHIAFEQTPFVVQRDTAEWKRPVIAGREVLRIAGLSSFGAGGSNAHLIVEEFDAPAHDDAPAGPVVIVLSAKTQERLKEQARRLRQAVQNADLSLASVAYTLQVGREAMDWRLACVADSVQALVQKLDAYLQGETNEHVHSGEVAGHPSASLFSADEELQEAVTKWVSRGKLARLAEAWVQGVDIDWRRLHGTPHPRPVSLPTYPFVEDRYWIAQPERLRSPMAALVRSDVQILVPRWEDRPLQTPTPVSGEARWVMLCEAVGCNAEELSQALGDAVQVQALRSSAQGLARRYTQMAGQLLEQLQQWMRSKPSGVLQLQLVVPASGEDQVLQGLAGLLKCAAKETPKLHWQLVAIGPSLNAAGLARCLNEEATQPDREVRFLPQRQVRQLQARAEVSSVPAPWKREGIYLITGGAGGLGLLLAHEIVRQAGAGVRLILTGRSTLTEAREGGVQALRDAGAQVEYHATDVSRREDVKQLVAHIHEQHGRLDGLIHAAGVLRDGLVLGKTQQAMEEVFAPKVQGLVHLDEATKEMALECFVAYSSTSAVVGNAGQADYAAANAFMDAYMTQRAQRVQQGVRRGRSLSIDWPLWEDGGMQVDEATRERMSRSGLLPLSNDDGMRSLHAALDLQAAQVVVMRRRAPDASAPHTPITVTTHAVDTPQLHRHVLHRLKSVFGRTTGLPVRDVDANKEFGHYGVDSVLAMKATAEFEEALGPLPKTLFYEHPNLQSLAAHFVQEHREGCIRWTGTEPASEAAAAPMPTVVERQPTQAESKPRDIAPTQSGMALPVAIIGLSGRYAQSPDLQHFWRDLCEGRSGVVEVPPERWSLEGFYASDGKGVAQAGKSYAKWGGFMPGVEEFDPLFFGIAPRDAENMDPQERLFLQASWAVLEDAGYTRQRLAQKHDKRVGVFAGITVTGYELHAPPLWARGIASFPRTSFSSVVNRVSYLLDLQGPSMPVDTMCSSSLTAIHEACVHLQRGECALAIAGGVNLYLHPSTYVVRSTAQMLASDGLCKSFGEGGDGFVPAEGVGAVLLKPLQRAIDDGDRIYGVIRGTAINHGGKTSGYTVPNPNAQAQVVAQALQQAGISARDISYVEAHGTGTSLGDPIEIAGLTKAYREHTQDSQYCAIGSAKSNIGHAESAAGIAGLTKVLLQMKHRTLVKSLHSETLNPHIAFDQTPFVVQQHTAPWQRPVVDGREVPRIAGLSSFGAGGSNAHIVVEEYEAPVRAVSTPGPVVIVLSAKNEERLQAQARQLMHALQDTDGALFDIAYTLHIGREAMDSRLACVVDSVQALRGTLEAYLAGRSPDHLHQGDAWRNKDMLEALQDELQQSIDSAIRQRKLHKLAELWAKGVTIDWLPLYGEHRPSPVSLPTYPFARERYWVADAVETTMPTAEPQPLLWFAETWQEQAVDTGKGLVQGGQVWLCVMRDPSRRAAFAQVARSLCQGREVQFLDPNADVTTALKDLRHRHAGIDAVLYLMPLEDEAARTDTLGLLQFTHNLIHSGLPCRRFLVAAQASNERDQLHQEAWIGISRSLKNAWPQMRMDLHLQACTEPTLSDEAWARRLNAELQTDGGSTLQQQGRRCICRVSAVERAIPGRDSLALRRGGCYLITGGAGGLGMVFARHLAAHYAADLVLVGRSPQDATRQAQVDELQTLGARALYLQADVANEQAMRDVLRTLDERFGTLHGVIHAAGVIGRHHDPHEVLSPKLQGTLVLERVLDGMALDFVCHFSSIAAVIGDFGRGDYACANRFLLAHAAMRQRASAGPTRWMAIAWPLWEGGGMSFGDEQQAQLYLQSSGQRALRTDEGLQVFEQLLASPNRNVLLTAGRPQRLETMLGVADQEPQNTQTAEELVDGLAQLVSELQRIPLAQLQADRNLADLGFDSIGLMHLARAIGERWGIEINATVFFNHPTLERLAAHLQQTHGMLRTAHLHPPVRPELAPSVRPELVEGPGETEPIAIIGMSGRMAGARTAQAFWQVLRDGRCAIEEIPSERFDWREHYGDPTELPHKTNGKWLGALPGVAEFDASFFEIMPTQACDIDPRQRLLLQEAWRALEDAAYGPQQLQRDSIGIFVGVEQGDYHHLLGRRGVLTDNHDAVLAARLAYFLDLRGPTMALNTACSSGLVAAHQACHSIRAGDCDAAIVAGVNLLLTPLPFLRMSEAGMLSIDGKCHAFDKKANGLVPGEAVVALVLKKLSRAQADGDPIHAVIIGSGINYDGKTNGITAPSGAAQARLLAQTYARSAINPGRIEYVVTHGTGTRLGDPIEINALAEAFGEGLRPQTCALTSNKPNIGHTFAASGLVNMMGLVLAMQHRQIPPSLNCDEDSDYIDWRKSPFYVNKQLRAWTTPTRVGAVSAFGMSGTNAHLVLQSIDQQKEHPANPPWSLLVLSAKTAPALQEQAQQLELLLKEQPSLSLQAMSQTLLNGRQHFKHRAAMVVRDAAQARQALTQLGLAATHAQLQQAEVAAGFVVSASLRQAAQRCLAQAVDAHDDDALRDSLNALAGWYCQGVDFDGAPLFAAATPRLHLPTYPFARQRHWTDGGDAADTTRTLRPHLLHPLLHENTSNLQQLRYTSRFSGQEFFLKDHRMQGRAVLPGVAQLEMVREAVRRSVMGEQGQVVAIEHVVFAAPITMVAGGQTVHVRLQREADAMTWQIYSESDNAPEAHVYSQGSATLQIPSPSDRLDWRALQQNAEPLTAQSCYERYLRMGMDYGPAMRGLQQLWTGNDAAGDYVLARLERSRATRSDGFEMDPSLADAALQASLALAGPKADATPEQTYLPFSIERVQCLRTIPDTGWALIRRTRSAANLRTLDVRLYDDEGEACLVIEGYVARAIAHIAQAPAASTVLYVPTWQPATLQTAACTPAAHRWIVTCGIEHHDITALREALDADNDRTQVLALDGAAQGLARRYGEMAQQLSGWLQEWMRSRPSETLRVQLVVPATGEEAVLFGLGGLLKTAALETPELQAQVVVVSDNIDTRHLMQVLDDEATQPNVEVRRVCGREVCTLQPTPARDATSWKNDGVYLVTGGAGGLGLLLAGDIVRRTGATARLILTGRSALDPAREAAVRALRDLGASVEYRQLDVSRRADVDRLIAFIHERHGRLDGVLHAAGVLRDALLVNKTPAQWQEVLAPKVQGLVNLDEATRERALDVFIAFSSVTAVLGNAGQGDYAAANAFMDAYMVHRAQRVARGERRGMSLSVDWPLWEHGGMQIDALARERLVARGLPPLASEAGLLALRHAWALGMPQVLVGTKELAAWRPSTVDRQTPEKPLSVSTPPDAPLSDRVRQVIAAAVGEVTGMSGNEIDPDEELQHYGFDSVSAMKLTRVLEKTFGRLPKLAPSVYFSHPTIGQLSTYLLQAHRAALETACGSTAASVPTDDVPEESAEAQLLEMFRDGTLNFDEVTELLGTTARQ